MIHWKKTSDIRNFDLLKIFIKIFVLMNFNTKGQILHKLMDENRQRKEKVLDQKLGFF